MHPNLICFIQATNLKINQNNTECKTGISNHIRSNCNILLHYTSMPILQRRFHKAAIKASTSFRNYIPRKWQMWLIIHALINSIGHYHRCNAGVKKINGLPFDNVLENKFMPFMPT